MPDLIMEVIPVLADTAWFPVLCYLFWYTWKHWNDPGLRVPRYPPTQVHQGGMKPDSQVQGGKNIMSRPPRNVNMGNPPPPPPMPRPGRTVYRCPFCGVRHIDPQSKCPNCGGPM